MKDLSNLPVEVVSHPREVVDDTLRSLIAFCDHLNGIAAHAANERDCDAVQPDLDRLRDGLGTLSEAVGTACRILGLAPMPEIVALTKDLESLLQDLTLTLYSRDLTYRMQLLTQHLPDNLRDWRDRAIPSLMRARDS